MRSLPAPSPAPAVLQGKCQAPLGERGKLWGLPGTLGWQSSLHAQSPPKLPLSAFPKEPAQLQSVPQLTVPRVPKGATQGERRHMATPVALSGLPCTWQCPTEQGGTVLPHPTARERTEPQLWHCEPHGSCGAGGTGLCLCATKSHVHIKFWSVTTSPQSPPAPAEINNAQQAAKPA